MQAVATEFKRLTAIGFPRRFPIVQFPNASLIVGLLVGAIGSVVDGVAHDYARSISYLAIGVWAYEELAHGVNWFRRLLGAGVAILTIMRIADALHR